MSKSLVTIIFFFVLNLLYAQNPIHPFKIEGQVKGFGNSTKLYLNDVTDGSYKKIDSAIIFNNRFSFNGRLVNSYLKASISTVDYADRVVLWIEKGLTSFSTNKGSFKKAIILGGAVQKKWSEYMQVLNTTKNEEASTYNFIKNNPTSIIAAHSLIPYRNIWSKDTVLRLYNSFSKNVQASEYGKKIISFVTLNRVVKIGDKFVDFVQKDSTDKEIRLSHVKGKITLLEFWGSWCGPCREENPTLVKIYDTFKPKGFEILGVAAETNKVQWLKAIQIDGLKWHNVTDFNGSDNTAAMIYGVTAYPTNFLINEEGVILAKDVYGDDLKDWLIKLL